MVHYFQQLYCVTCYSAVTLQWQLWHFQGQKGSRARCQPRPTNCQLPTSRVHGPARHDVLIAADRPSGVQWYRRLLLLLNTCQTQLWVTAESVAALHTPVLTVSDRSLCYSIQYLLLPSSLPLKDSPQLTPPQAHKHKSRGAQTAQGTGQHYVPVSPSCRPIHSTAYELYGANRVDTFSTSRSRDGPLLVWE